MAIKIKGTKITITQTSPPNTYDIWVTSLFESRTVEFFQRLEFNNERLKQAKNIDGSRERFETLPNGIEYQIASDCNPESTVRDIGTDDGSYDDQYKKWVIQKYDLVGLPNTQANVDALYDLHQSHRILYERYENHIQKAKQDVSFDTLVAMQAETFSYLTTTGISASARSIDTFSDCLIEKFVPGMEYDYLDENGNLVVLKSFNATIEKRTLKAAGATS